MQEGPLTTILVHSLLDQEQKSHQQDRCLRMQYEEYTPPECMTDLSKRIRCRSIYLNKGDEKSRKIKDQQSVKASQSMQNGKIVKEVRRVDVQFQTFSKARSKRSSQTVWMPTKDYQTIMLDSMQKHISKIEKVKQRKLQKCQKIKQFGVNIQAIKSSQRNKNQYILKVRSKNCSLTSKNKSDSMANSHILSSLHSEFIQSMQKPQASHSDFNCHQTTIPIQGASISSITQFRSTVHPSQFFSQTISTSNPIKNAKFLPYKKTDNNKQMNSVQRRLVRMISSLQLFLASFGVRIISQPREEEKITKKIGKYSYFIGKGNNKNLIISILKKRQWWAEAQDITSADFVWTQLKLPSILQKIPSMLYSDLKEANAQIIKTQRPPKANLLNIGLFHPMQSKKISVQLTEKQKFILLRPMKRPAILHNHYEANYMLGNKKALYYNICEYKNYKLENSFQFMPLTFHVQNVDQKSFKSFECAAKQQKNSVWIIKPGENTNRGKGIFVSDSVEDIRKRIQRQNKNHTYIIQKYIKNNFTFQKRKFDIRTYLLMVSIGGVLKFYWYSQGYLRTSSEVYDLHDLDDPFIHLTNDSIQINSQNYGKFQKGNKVTYHQFQRYLDINFPAQKYSVAELNQRMKSIAKQVVQATYFKLDPCQKQCSFELFGMDFLIDSSFKPWLLEVNTNPCLQLSGPVLQRLIPRMVENLFRIAIDPIFQPSSKMYSRNLAYFIPENFFDGNRFELIFDWLYDRRQDYEEYSRQKSKYKVYQDEQEEFENDGQLIKIQN